MGNSINTIRTNAFRRNSSMLLNVKLGKLRDYHASFKSICDNFAIDLTEFEHIFGIGESAFVIWDTDNNGLVDSLQLFSGIAIFCDTKLEDKIRFLFDIFDFNEMDMLAAIDVEFMLYCCISATFKIFSISGEIETTELAGYIKEKFHNPQRITVAELIRTAKQSRQIIQFMDIIKIDNGSKEIAK